jgi:hypothetical protein
MMPIKGNLAKKQKGTLYKVVESTKPVKVLDERKNKMVESFHPRIQWGEATERAADEVMREHIGGRGAKEDKTADAMDVITKLFCDPDTGEYRPTPVSNKVFRKATIDFSVRTIDKAKAKLGIDYDLKTKSFTMDEPAKGLMVEGEFKRERRKTSRPIRKRVRAEVCRSSTRKRVKEPKTVRAIKIA